jgi:hypothetical protein
LPATRRAGHGAAARLAWLVSQLGLYGSYQFAARDQSPHRLNVGVHDSVILEEGYPSTDQFIGGCRPSPKLCLWAQYLPSKIDALSCGKDQTRLPAYTIEASCSFVSLIFWLSDSSMFL